MTRAERGGDNARWGTMELGTLRRLHSASGLIPLGGYLCFHAWEHWPLRDGRDALFARLESTAHPLLESLFVLLPLCLHAGLGLRLAREPDERYRSLAHRRLQLATGVLAGLFLLAHIATSWVPRLLDPNPVGAAYGATVEASGTLAGLVWHAIGVAAVCTHFGQGMGAALPRLLGLRARPARWLGVLVAVLLWLLLLNELASYATYAPLL